MSLKKYNLGHIQSEKHAEFEGKLAKEQQNFI